MPEINSVSVFLVPNRCSILQRFMVGIMVKRYKPNRK
jgi:hypothetical protein